jgi:CRP/FNR family transcriptional regulator, nitrogen oxide reductase regulator
MRDDGAGPRYTVREQHVVAVMSRLNERLLDDLPPFVRLSRSERREVLDLATLRRWEEGSSVFREGDPAERFLLLLDGVIRVIRTTPQGEQVVPLHIPAGQLFGIAPAIGRDTYPGTAVAAVPCTTLSWPAPLWFDFARRFEGFGTGSWAEIGERMQELHRRIAELATKPVEVRVALALLRMAKIAGRSAEGGGVEIAIPLTRATIAEMTGATLHSVSRVLAGWVRDGIVSGGRRRIVLCRPQFLEHLVARID